MSEELINPKKLKKQKKKKETKKNLFDNIPSIMSLMIPDTLEENKDKLYLGANRYTRNFVLTVYPTEIYLGWLDDLFYYMVESKEKTYKEVLDSIDELKNRAAEGITDGYTRGYKNKGGGVKSHYLNFYNTFGVINSSLGAKFEYILELDEEDTEIYFNRTDGGYELVLQKNQETGEWERPNK